MLRRLLLATVLVCSACSTGNTEKAHSGTEWRSYGHDYFNQRFSQLDQINRRNVQQLAPVYVFQTGVLGAFETNPIVADGVMYLTSAYDGVFAIDARSGKLLWKRDPLTGTFRHCCGPVNRGVALAGDLVLIGQLDGSVVALDRKSGLRRWSVRVADNAQGYSITMAPVVYRDSVIVGLAGGDLGIRGALIALALRDGKVRWHWFSTDPQHWFGRSARLRTDTGYLEGRAASEARNRYANSWVHGGGGILDYTGNRSLAQYDLLDDWKSVA